MAYIPVSIYSVLQQISKGEIMLPHIQRPFVWDEEQMAQLLDSLLKGYPIQTFLFWKTQDAIAVRRFQAELDPLRDVASSYDEASSKENVVKTLVLDGQQRIQSLYTLFTGGVVMHVSKGKKGQSALRKAYINLAVGAYDDSDRIAFFSDEQLKKHLAAVEKAKQQAEKDPTKKRPGLQFWYEITSLYPIAGDEANSLASELLATRKSEVPVGTSDTIRANFTALHNVLTNSTILNAETLDQTQKKRYNLDTVLDIFIRVNRGGTRLAPFDLLFAKIKGSSSRIERNVSEVLGMLNKANGMSFENDFILRSVLVAMDKKAQLKPELFDDKLVSDIEAKWLQVFETYKALSDFISRTIKVHGTKGTPGYVIFTPIFDYLYMRQELGLPAAPNEVDCKKLKAFYFSGVLFNWFGLHTDGALNSIHEILLKNKDAIRVGGFPLDAVKAHFKAEGFETEFTDELLDFDGKRRVALLDLVYSHHTGGSAYSVDSSQNYPHIDHIYPQKAVLAELYGIAPVKKGEKATQDYNEAVEAINDIGNFRLFQASLNMSKNDKHPLEYFSDRSVVPQDGLKCQLLVDEYVNDLSRLAWTKEAFLEFTAKRRAAILQIVKNAIEAV
jgi:hypothetical protein